jgi:hypothetical protein
LLATSGSRQEDSNLSKKEIQFGVFEDKPRPFEDSWQLLRIRAYFFPVLQKNRNCMNNLFRGLLAGAGAKWLGGGLISTVVIFFILWAVLGQCQ